MTAIENTAFARLNAEKRLINAVHKGPTQKSGRYGFRGEFALKFQPQVADEARPPELALAQVNASAKEGESALEFVTGFLWSFEHIKDVADSLQGLLSSTGKYILWVNNIDLLAKYKVPMGDVTFYVLPLDEATVYNETLELLNIERNDLKKLDTAGKIDAMVDAALGFDSAFQVLSYEDGLKIMGPVKDPGENRPV